MSERNLLEEIERLRMEIERLKKKVLTKEAGKVKIKIVEEEKPKEVERHVEKISDIGKWIIDEIREAIKEQIDTVSEGLKERVVLVDTLDPLEIENDLKILASKERLYILKLLFREGKYFTELEEHTGLNPSPLTFHLSKLIEGGFVSQEKTRGRYLITTKGRVALMLLGYLHQFMRRISER